MWLSIIQASQHRDLINILIQYHASLFCQHEHKKLVPPNLWDTSKRENKSFKLDLREM